MTSTQMTPVKLQDTSHKKSLRALLKGSNNHNNIAEISNDLNNYFYVRKFNAELVKSHETDYITKNSHLFTWRQTLTPQNKLKVPPSIKQRVSQLNINHKEIEDIMTPDVSPKNSNNEQYYMVKVADCTSLPSAKSRKNAIKDIHRDIYPTQSVTELGEKDEIHQKKPVSLPASARGKKSYSSTKIQMNLLNNEDSSFINQVPNIKFMLNQFDRKNYTINKIISQISANQDMLDPEELKEETLKKIKFMEKEANYKKLLTPRTASNSITKTKVSLSPSHKNAIHMRTLPFSNIKCSKNKGYKIELSLPSSRSIRPKNLKSIKDWQETHTQRSSKMSIFKKEDDTPMLRLIDKEELRKLTQKTIKMNEKPENLNQRTKSYVMSLDAGLKDIDFGRDVEMKSPSPSPSPSPRRNREKKATGFFTTLQSRRESSISSFLPVDKAKVETRDLVSPRVASTLADDNIFNYGKYFKKKYFEKGSEFKLSKDLKNRVRTFERELAESLQRIKTGNIKEPGN